MQPVPTAGLRIAPYSSVHECLTEPQRSLPHVMERRCLTGIEIKYGLIGLCQVWDMGPPQVKFDGSLVGEPEQTCRRVDQGQMNWARDRLGMICYPPEPGGSRCRTVAQVVRYMAANGS